MLGDEQEMEALRLAFYELMQNGSKPEDVERYRVLLMKLMDNKPEELFTHLSEEEREELKRALKLL